MSTPNGPVLRKQELDAFLLTAFSSDLTNAHYLQDLQVCIPCLTGVTFERLFRNLWKMEGYTSSCKAREKYFPLFF